MGIVAVLRLVVVVTQPPLVVEPVEQPVPAQRRFLAPGRQLGSSAWGLVAALITAGSAR